MLQFGEILFPVFFMEYIQQEQLRRESLLLKIINFLRDGVLQADPEMHLELRIQVTGEHLIIKRNIIDFNGSFNYGYFGIYIDIPTGTESIVIEQNTLRGSVQYGIYLWGFIGGFCDSVVIANNMINTNSSIGLYVDQSQGNVKILFNTIMVSGAGLEGLRLHSPNCIVLNNIILGKVTGGGGYNVCYNQGNGQSPNLLSDYNVLYMPGSTALSSTRWCTLSYAWCLSKRNWFGY